MAVEAEWKHHIQQWQVMRCMDLWYQNDTVIIVYQNNDYTNLLQFKSIFVPLADIVTCKPIINA